LFNFQEGNIKRIPLDRTLLIKKNGFSAKKAKMISGRIQNRKERGVRREIR
jgi:hypothetical protein